MIKIGDHFDEFQVNWLIFIITYLIFMLNKEKNNTKLHYNCWEEGKKKR